MALTLLLGAGTGLTACSDDSSDDQETTTASSSTTGSSSAAPSGSGTPDSPAPESGDAPEGDAPAPQGDGDADQAATPVDPATAILGPDDAPAGFTVADPQQDTDTAGMQEALDAMTVTPPECKAVLQERMAVGDAAAAGVSTVTYSDGGQQAIVVGAGASGTNQADDQCSNLTAEGDMGGLPVSIISKAEDVPVNLDGVENVRGIRSTVTTDIAGQKNAVNQTTITGTVNGNDFSVTGMGEVSQDVLLGLAQTQADRLRG
ncbi:hypothetical protein [Corynebacterium variabile]|uniref:hypothetical protein n=1 Tax=Corynebacterium variabile TaxID=1727 RepID=UPI003A8FF262